MASLPCAIAYGKGIRKDSIGLHLGRGIRVNLGYPVEHCLTQADMTAHREQVPVYSVKCLLGIVA